MYKDRGQSRLLTRRLQFRHRIEKLTPTPAFEVGDIRLRACFPGRRQRGVHRVAGFLGVADEQDRGGLGHRDIAGNGCTIEAWRATARRDRREAAGRA
jgi:hypothetical protein